MGDGSLSQDEIDALLQGAEDPSYETSPSAGPSDDLSPAQKDMLEEVLLFAFGQAAKILETALSKSVNFTSPVIESKPMAEVSAELGAGSVNLFSNWSGTVNGRNSLIFSTENASKVINIILGGLSTGTLDSNQLQRLKDTFAPVIGNLTIQIGTKIQSMFAASPLEVSHAKTAKDLILPDAKTLIKTTLNMSIEGVGVFKAYYIISKPTVEELLSVYQKGGQKAQPVTNGGINVTMPPQQNFATQQSLSSVPIKGVAFPSLATAGQPSGATNLNLLMDVQMSVTVELGRTKMYIKDILGLGEGSIIELDKLAGEPVDLLVNGKLIAKGEVVVIDENFGVRVTDIVSPTDRIKTETK
ncbi:MAG: flagellar motor switch protein FliN [Leptospiraceae bacterium]|nr:flagellar motor switch protein FliN [Leptospiraceae bacterium]